MMQKELENIIRAIKSENWAYVVRNIPRLKHSDQFHIFDQLPTKLLQELHHQLFEMQGFLVKELYETEYSCVAAVTILRKQGAYTDTKWPSVEITETRFQVNEAIKKIWQV
jgi:hypothetical protein